MKILILGHKGMLGHELVKAFKEHNELVLWDRDEIDISQKQQVIERVGNLKPDIIINAAAYTAVDKAESNKDLVYKINGCAVGFLADICKNINALLIHFSTDYVFNGENHLGYKENDSHIKPLSVYGKSKALGERMVSDINPRHYLVRTSWLFGKSGNNFIETMLKLSLEKKEIRVVDDQFGSPTYAKDLAEEIRDLVESKKPYGIYHITNSQVCSWYEFAKEIFRLTGLSVKLTPVKSEEFPAAAKRPTYSMLINTKLSPMRTWKEALKEYLAETGRIIRP